MKFDNIVGIQKATSEQVRKTGHSPMTAVAAAERSAQRGSVGSRWGKERRKILCARLSCFKQCDKMVLVTLN